MINAGSIAWVLVSAALVMLTTPGLAFFYGGLVRNKNVLNIMMMNIMMLAVVGVMWAVYGYSLAFGNDSFAGLIGGFDHIGLRDSAAAVGPESDRIPLLAFTMFQLMFAVITAALVSGAIAQRTSGRPVLRRRLGQLGRQLVASGAALAGAFGVSLLLGWLIKVTIGFRADREEEMSGLDEIEHAETAYEFSTLGGTSRGAQTLVAPRPQEASR